MFEPYLWSPVGIVWVTLTAAVDAYRVLYTRVWIYCTPHGAQMCCDAMWSIVCELLWLVLHRSHNAPIHTRHPVGRIHSNTCEPHAPHSYCATCRSGHDDVCAHPHYNNMFESQCTSTRPNCYCRAKRNACVCGGCVRNHVCFICLVVVARSAAFCRKPQISGQAFV